MYLVKYYPDFKTALTIRLRNERRTFLADKWFFEMFDELRVCDRKSPISGISPNLYSNLWISSFQKRKRFCDKLILKPK